MQFVDLSRHRLAGHIPTEVGRVRRLKCLCLSSNQLAGQLFVSTLRSTKMQMIDLHMNSMNGQPPCEYRCE